MLRIFICQPLLYCYLITGMLLPKGLAEKPAHPLHVSKADISLNDKSKHLEVICSIFTDDFEAALAKQNASIKVDLVAPAKHDAMDALVKKYILNHLQIKTDAKAVALNYVGFEIEKEMVNVYLESGEVTAFKRLDAEISLLYDLYDDQSNIVHITIKGKRNSTKIDNPDRKVSAYPPAP